MFNVDGEACGGTEDKEHDPVLLWELEKIGGCKGKNIVELGPYEGGQTVALCRGGANTVIGIESNPNAYVRCLVTKRVMNLHNAEFVYADAAKLLPLSKHPPIDFVLANGVLYHQRNPAKLIYDLAEMTDAVLVWTQVANDTSPSNLSAHCEVDEKLYHGRLNTYGERKPEFSGGPNPTSLWLFPEEMRRCFKEAGFNNWIEKPCFANGHGDCMLFVARK